MGYTFQLKPHMAPLEPVKSDIIVFRGMTLERGVCLVVEPGERHEITNSGSAKLVLIYFGGALAVICSASAIVVDARIRVTPPRIVDPAIR